MNSYMLSSTEKNGHTPRSWVPWKWQHIVCVCPDPTYKHPVNYEDLSTKNCSTCGKFARWMLGRCKLCGEMYISCFIHLESGATCYDCLVDQYGADSFKIDRPIGDYSPRTPKSIEEVSSELDDFFNSVLDYKPSVDFDL